MSTASAMGTEPSRWVAEILDFFTGVNSIGYEEHGLAERVGGDELVEATATRGGALPVDPSGGLCGKVHPQGATFAAQCVELVQQPRGDAVSQADRAPIALVHNLSGAASVTTNLEGPWANGS